jgi:hypothetical protein
VPSTTVATSARRTGAPAAPPAPRRSATAISAKVRGSCTRPVTRTRRSLEPLRTRPAGTSWFSRCSAAMTCGGLTAVARIAAGSSCTLICRSAPPTTFTPPTPGDALEARRDHLVGQVGELAQRAARLTAGRWT